MILYEMSDPKTPWHVIPTLYLLRTELELHGARYADLVPLISDLDAGHVLTLDDGTSFRRVTHLAY